MKPFKQHFDTRIIQEAIDYHYDNNIPLSECIFRSGSESFYNFFQEVKKQYNEGVLEVEDLFDKELLETDIGERYLLDDEYVPLDLPISEEKTGEYNGREVELEDPKRGGGKKFYVYVRNDKGNVIKVEFGDTSGLQAKINDPEARKSFSARHNCSQKTDKTKPGYWSCRLPYYAKQLGLKGGGKFFW